MKTLLDKIWERHIVSPETEDTPAVLYIDLHLIHEVTSPQAFQMLRENGLSVRQPQKTFATMDHSTPTLPAENGKIKFHDAQAQHQVEQLERNCAEFGIRLAKLGDENQGIVHVIGPELGLTQPGKTIVCGDSHTSTHGAFGALAFGIGTSEVGYTFATQCILQNKPKSMGIKINGKLSQGVTAKDLILAIIAKIGIGGGTGHVIEYFGEAISAMSMDERMTICNMSIEAGARAGMIAPDETTFTYLKEKPYAPKGTDWERSVSDWNTLTTDKGALYDKLIEINADDLEPMITYGTNPEMGIGIHQKIPTNVSAQSLAYMNFSENESLIGKKVDVVFIGSCTNSRISDLRAAADILKGHRISSTVKMIVVPGSQAVKKQAESEGLHHIFIEAGAEWREPGCSMCLGMNGDQITSGQLCISTSNRNFEGRQGKGGRTILASPITATASAIVGEITDPRHFLEDIHASL